MGITISGFFMIIGNHISWDFNGIMEKSQLHLGHNAKKSSPYVIVITSFS